MRRHFLYLSVLAAALANCTAQQPGVPVVTPPAAPAATPPETDPQHRDLTRVTEQPHTAPPTNVVPRSYALVIGIAKYQKLGAKAQLQFSTRDAQDIYTTLISSEGGNFPAQNVHKLIDDQATLANVRQEIEHWLPSVSGPEDRVLIYFAGHGFIAGGKAYLAPYDVDRSNLAGTAYPMDELGKTIGGVIKGKWKVLITDACHSGAITPEDDNAKVNKSLLDLNTSMFSITASRDREQSFESTAWGGGHGIFTYYVIKGLEGDADASGDGIVTADELAEYVRTNVRLATKTLQNPTSDRGSFDPNMVLAYNPGATGNCADKNTCAQKPRYGTLIIESNMDGVEVLLDGKTLGVFAKGSPQRFPGITPGPHTVQGVHLGYEPDGPREVELYPGQDATVSIRIVIARQHSHAAVEPFQKGVELYNRGFEANYKLAAAQFEQALAIDPHYSQAALYLGRTYQALFEEDKAREVLKRAIAQDPDFLEARLSYAAVLLDLGNFDEAIRNTNAVLQRESQNGMAWYLQSQAFVRKGSYDQAVTSGQSAVKYTPFYAEAHLWLADALRLSKRWGEAEPEYQRYLALSNFNSAIAGKLNYYILGSLLGVGRKSRASQQDIWRELHAQANVGICDCEWMQKHYDSAGTACLKALSYEQDDPYANYRLGVVYAQEYNQGANAELLKAAREHFSVVISLNPDTDEAAKSRKYVANIDAALPH